MLEMTMNITKGYIRFIPCYYQPLIFADSNFCVGK